MKRKKLFLIIGIAAVSIALLITLYFILTSSRSCTTQECFNQDIVDCKKSIYIKETQDTITQYNIRGQTGDSCKIIVTLLQFKKGTTELAPLEVPPQVM